MNSVEQSAVTFPTLSVTQRLRAMLGVVIVGVVFVAVVGRSVLVPHDPAGCVSVMSCRLGWWIIPVCALLAFLLAMMVCAVSGAGLEDLGVFAVTLGLSLAVLRFGDAGYLWATFGQADDRLRSALAGRMAVEALGWTAVVAAAHAGSLFIIRNLNLRPVIASSAVDDYRRGVLTVLFTGIIAALLLQLFSAGTELAPIQMGQVCFAVAMSFYLAALIAYQLTGAHSPVWAYLAVGLVAVLGYVWTVFQPTPTYPGRVLEHLAHFSPTAFGRALPVQAVMIGAAAAIFGNWHQRQLSRYAAVEDEK